MKTRHILQAILLCMAHGALCCGISAQTINIDQARALALEHNSRVGQAALQHAVAEQAVRQYRAMYMPDFSLGGGALYSTASGSLLNLDLSAFGSQITQLVTGIAATNPLLAQQLGGMAAGLPQRVALDYKVGAVFAAGLTLKQPLYMGGKIQAANSIARKSRVMSAENRRLTNVEVIEQVDEAYIGVVRAGELEQVALRYHEMLCELERNVQSAINVGLKMNNDLLRVQVKKNEVELQLRRAQNALRLATMNLNQIMGMALDAPTEVCHDIPVATPPQDGAPSMRPEAAIMQQRCEIAAQEVRMARSEALPQVALLANYGYGHGGELKLNSERRDVLDGFNFNGGVTVKVPLFHFGERQAKIKTARLKQQMAQLEAADVDEKLQLALAQARNNMDEARLEAEISARSLSQAEENLRLCRQQYDAGMMPLSDLLDAQALWQQAYERSIESRCNIHTATTALQKATGTLQ